MSAARTLYQHPDGAGRIEATSDTLRITNELHGTSAAVRIGPAGLRELAEQLREQAERLERSGRAK